MSEEKAATVLPPVEESPQFRVKLWPVDSLMNTQFRLAALYRSQEEWVTWCTGVHLAKTASVSTKRNWSRRNASDGFMDSKSDGRSAGAAGAGGGATSSWIRRRRRLRYPPETHANGALINARYEMSSRNACSRGQVGLCAAAGIDSTTVGVSAGTALRGDSTTACLTTGLELEPLPPLIRWSTP